MNISKYFYGNEEKGRKIYEKEGKEEEEDDDEEEEGSSSAELRKKQDLRLYKARSIVGAISCLLQT